MRCIICDELLNESDDLEICRGCAYQINIAEHDSVTDVMMTQHDHINERANPNAWAREYREAETYEQVLYEQSICRGTRL